MEILDGKKLSQQIKEIKQTVILRKKKEKKKYHIWQRYW